MFIMLALGILFGIAETICYGKKWLNTDKGNVWLLYMVWFTGGSFFKLVLILNGVPT